MNKEALIALGLTPEQADKVLTLHKGSIDGNYVPKQTFEAEREQVKTLKSQVTERDNQIKELGTFKGTAEQLQTKVTELETKNKQVQTEFDQKLEKVQKEGALKVELAGRVNDVNDILPKLDLTKIAFKDGKIESGLKEQVDAIEKSHPHYFKTQKSETKPTGWVFGNTPPDSKDSNSDEKDESVLFGANLAKSRTESTDMAKKANDYYFK